MPVDEDLDKLTLSLHQAHITLHDSSNRGFANKQNTIQNAIQFKE